MFVFNLNFWILKYNNFNLYFYKTKIELIFIYLIISMSLIVLITTNEKYNLLL